MAATPSAFGWYFCSSEFFFSTSKASGADAQKMSGGLDRVSRMKAMAAALLRFCTSTLVPGYFFSKAWANGVVRSFENEVTMVSLSPMLACPWASAGGRGQRDGGGEQDSGG